MPNLNPSALELELPMMLQVSDQQRQNESELGARGSKTGVSENKSKK
jgi:hypothetical protein